MNFVQQWIDPLQRFLSTPVIDLGKTRISLWTFLYLGILLFLLFYVTAKIRNWIVDRLLVRTNVHIGVRQAVGTIIRYFIIVVGFLIILQTAGIDLTTLNVLAGAVGIGIGFGLQNVANNFVSGLIILFERPIKIGDRIDVGNVEGDVVSIGARSTTVMTNDNIAIIIPNSKLISENVVNWSYNDESVRFRIPVSVAYGSDVRLVEKLLLEVARESPDVLEAPPPAVRFLEFGDNGLLLELRAWTSSLAHRKGMLISTLNFGIHDKFKENHIEIPYPQRDLHLRSSAVELKAPGSVEPEKGTV